MNIRSSTIKTERLTLHGLNVSDAENMIDILTNEEVALTYMLPKFTCREEAYKLFERIMNLSNSEDKFVYGIYLNERIIGFTNEVEKNDEFIELGYVIDPEFKGNGYATEALKASINELFSMGYPSVKTGAFEKNVASMRVMEKSGMTRCDFTETVEYNGKQINCIIYMIKKASE